MAPAIVGALILLTYSSHLLNPYRPQWTKPFLQETKAESDELDDTPRSRFTLSTYGLLAIASIGLILQISGDYLLLPDLTETLYTSIAWVSNLAASYKLILMQCRLLLLPSLY
jgi:hypothetical protein